MVEWEEEEEEEEEEGDRADTGVRETLAESARAVRIVPPIEHTTPAIFHQLNCSEPARTANANVNMPEVALMTVFDVTDVCASDKLYRPLAANQRGQTMRAARSVGQSYMPRMMLRQFRRDVALSSDLLSSDV